jgi:Kef-type K+ transport system membrane component KefB
MSETGCFVARGNGSAAAASNGRSKIANCSPCISREQWLESEVNRLRNELRQKDKDTEAAVAASSTSPDAKQLSAGSEVVDTKQVKVTLDGSPGDTTPSQAKAVVDDYREDISAVMREESEGAKDRKPGNKVRKTPSERFMNMSSYFLRDGVLDRSSLANSILGFQKPMAVSMYIVAFAGIVFVLISQAKHLGADDSHASTSTCGATEVAESEDDHHRLLYGVQGRRLGGDAAPLIIYIAFVLTASGLIALIMNAIGMPLILGYILGGVLVGPECLKIVDSDGQSEMEVAASLGLIFLLFMIGLELDVKELLKMGKVVLCTGFLQYPVCFGIMWGICTGLGNSVWGGSADYPLAAMYCGMVCGISSTMIVVKALSEKFETDTQSGRLTIGILIFQDIWAIVVLAVQPKLDNPDIVAIFIIFGKMAILLAISLTYAKFVVPAVLFYASKSVELMLVLSLAWCFFIGCIAIQPYMGLSFELASLIAGVALATFPYSAEFNGKIKFIRDFFITLFFAQLGMQIPVPEPLPILTAMLMAVIVVAIRPVGIFLIARLMGADAQLASLATLNLSQISEFALVICSLGTKYCHIGNTTLTIIIWTFAILAISATFVIESNAKIYRFLAAQVRRIRGKAAPVEDGGKQDEVSFQLTVVNLDCDILDDHGTVKRAFEEAITEVVSSFIGTDQETASGKVSIDCALVDGNSTQVSVDINLPTSQSKAAAARLNEGISETMLPKLREVPGITEVSVGDLKIEDVSEAVVTAGHDQDHHGHDDIVLLGFHRIAFMLVAEFQAKSPEMLKHLHVIDTNQSIMPTLRKKGIKCSYGDICAPDVLLHCHHGEPRLVISTIPDSLLNGVTNAKLLKIAQEVWPTANYIVTADNPQQATQLYTAGASYVLRSAKLCAERLQDLLTKHRSSMTSSESELAHLFNSYRAKDKDKRTSFIQQRLH